MKASKYFLILFFVSLAAFSNTIINSDQPIQDPPDEFTTLAKYLENNVGFIKGDFPIVDADEIKKNLKK